MSCDWFGLLVRCWRWKHDDETNGTLKQTGIFSQKLLPVWKVSLNLPVWLQQSLLALILQSTLFIHLLALYPCVVNNSLCCFHFGPAAPANLDSLTSLSDARLLEIYPTEKKKKKGEKWWNGIAIVKSSVKALGKAKIPNVTASTYLIKREKKKKKHFSRCWRNVISAAAIANLLMFS